ncbi:RNA polymerase sigma-70 factor (ECF subfamily) [Actinoplanes octamycinicus]|uniref:RNA polymerase sigma factor n=1 Tax=Actinoplanes octamycinicus TaxID=135948 RepID=A0A7W7GUS8_9ACTN|nr:sigma-70 family RNA polymerase sigma factor [Actinoplanes octamycinicus]MBB4738592.1 RNA polymerase sigma-70 factor (ECF subfamily) [Actinoplanes octamycinicus]GIE57718.1 RNA polymerase sigma factor [Actinoplanes octamycinicus]
MKRRVSPDEQLMTALYTEHYSVLLNFVSRYVSDRHKAEDLVQETLLRAWKHIDHLDPEPGRTRSYLLTIARNVVTNAWRAEQRRPRLVSDETAVNSVPSADNVDQMVEGWLVAEALERLSPEHRAVIQAMYYEGQSVADAARRLSVPEGTVKSRAYYAVRALRAVFEEMGMLRSGGAA